MSRLLLAAVAICLSSCASSVDIPAKIRDFGQALDSGVTYRAKGSFQERNTPDGTGRAYEFEMIAPLFVRCIRLDTTGDIKRVNVYIRTNSNWDLVYASTKNVTSAQRIHINRRTAGVRVVQPSLRHDEFDHVDDILVFVQDKKPSEEMEDRDADAH
ncbi:MAG: hypothetical protein OXN17_19375 [Candidatus Poribacteria bacterium]|nr:hypothetical protein [Candidatus Poribacteria bacterium]MDE0506691.1 hypothetical protein [Candidatus Poribacteria bacterium]